MDERMRNTLKNEELANSDQQHSSVKAEPMVKNEHGVKSESGVKAEGGVKSEGGKGQQDDPDCFIDKIDYSKKIPNFAKLPSEVVKAELQTNGIRINALNKKKTTECITMIWQYRKHGELPLKYIFEEGEEDGDLPMPVH